MRALEAPIDDDWRHRLRQQLYALVEGVHDDVVGRAEQ